MYQHIKTKGGNNLYKSLVCIGYLPYLCSVFFMVLDLRLTKRIGCRETTNSCFVGVPFLWEGKAPFLV